MDSAAFIVIALFVLAAGLISARLERSVVTPPMLFVGFGLLIGPAGLGFVELDVESELLHTLAEATLILVLFTDASRIDLRALRQEYMLPARMLAIGLPLTIALGTAVAYWLLDGLGIWAAAALAAILAPTDAALGQAVVSSKKVPVRIRQALNVESGLNDGIALPFVMIFLSLAAASEAAQSASTWALYGLGQVTLGPLVGVAVGLGGGKLVERASRASWMNHSFQQISALALALLAFALAERVGGNGFIAAFAAGLTIGNACKAICECLYEFAEAEGQLLMLLAFLVFGAADVMPAFEQFTWPCIGYAVLSLTVIRMAPISLSLLGAGVKAPTHLFLGWFGPRGLASILYVLLMLERVNVPGRDVMFTVVILAVVLSVFAHGLTAVPGSNWYARHADRMRTKRPDCPELQSAPEIRPRIQGRAE